MSYTITRNTMPQQFAIRLAAYSPGRQTVAANIGAGLPAVQVVAIRVDHVFVPITPPDPTMTDSCPSEPT
jgi:hypothetical protein